MTARAPFVLLTTLVGLWWITLWTVRLPLVELPLSARLDSPQVPWSSQQTRRRKPAHPLRPYNLQVVQNATPVELALVDLSENHQADPHRGARDEHGNWGYVLNVSSMQSDPPPYPTDMLEKHCQERDDHHTMLTQRVFVDVEAHDEAKERDRAKILCIIYSTDAAHETKIPAIRETWGQKCDGFMVGSNKTDATINAVDIPHEGPEIYRNMFHKVQAMWAYVYDYYYDQFDWFHIGGDDMYVLVENLRLYLESDEIQAASNGGIYLPTVNETVQTPLYLGRRFAFDGKMARIYNSGGPGYTLNKAALKLLVTSGFGSGSDKRTYAEDVFVAKAFREKGVLAYDTKDEDGGERYMHFPPGLHVAEKLDMQYSWYKKDSIDIKMGLNHSAPRSISFHYISPDLMWRMHALLYGMCDSKL